MGRYLLDCSIRWLLYILGLDVDIAYYAVTLKLSTTKDIEMNNTDYQRVFSKYNLNNKQAKKAMDIMRKTGCGIDQACKFALGKNK